LRVEAISRRVQRLAGRHLTVLGGAIDMAPAADQPLDVSGGAGLAERQQSVLGLRRRDTREGADLGVGQLAVSEGMPELRQPAERACRPHALAGGVERALATSR